MNTLRRLSVTLLSVIIFSGMGLAAPVSAHAVNEDSSTSSNTDAEAAEAADNSDSSTKSATLRDQFKALAQQDVAKKKAQVKEQTQANRQKVCEARKAGLTKRMSTAVKVAQTHKTNIDRIYAKVKAFHDSKNLTVSNYDSLVVAADAAGADAAANISALQGLDVSIDCTSSTVADSVSAFQQAVKATRDSLKTYRTDIIAVITALKGASSVHEAPTGSQ